MEQSHHLSAPYPPTTASGNISPSPNPDVPISAVFLALYILGAVGNMTILQINLRRGHKFLISGMLFGFCMARIVTMIMRIVWATRARNIHIAIAANIFVFSGVVLLYVVNLLFAQRIIRACHPRSGWHSLFHWAFIGMYIWIVLTLVMLLTTNVQNFYTLNKNTKRIDRDIQLYGQFVYAMLSFLPVPLIIFGLVLPRKTRLEKFGHGRFRTKIYVLTASTLLLSLGALFRLGTNWAGGKRPRSNPAAYQSKACFYIFNFVVEILVVYLYILLRVDKRFFVPNGSKKSGDYLRRDDFYNLRDQKKTKVMEEKVRSASDHILSEEEVFDDAPEQPEKTDAAVDIEKSYMANEGENKSKGQTNDLGATVPRSPITVPGNAHVSEKKV